MNIKTVCLYLIMALLWASTWPASKIAVSHLSPFLLTAVRCLFAIVFLGIILRVRSTSLRLRRDEIAPLFIVSLLMMILPFGLVMWGLKYTTGGMCAVIFATNPIFIFLLSLFIKDGEKITTAKVGGSLLGFFGTILIFLPSIVQLDIDSVKGELVILLCSLIYAFAVLYARRHTAHIPANRTVFYQTLFAAPVLLVVGLILESPHEFAANFKALPAWTSVVYLALVGNSLGFLFFFWFINHYGAAVASAGIYPEIAFVFILEWLIFRTIPTTVGWFGTAAILIGVWLITRRQKPVDSQTVGLIQPEV